MAKTKMTIKQRRRIIVTLFFAAVLTAGYHLLLSSWMFRNFWLPMALEDTEFIMVPESVSASLIFRTVSMKNIRIRIPEYHVDLYSTEMTGRVQLFPFRFLNGEISGLSGKRTGNSKSLLIRNGTFAFQQKGEIFEFLLETGASGSFYEHKISETKLRIRGKYFSDRFDIDFQTRPFIYSVNDFSLPVKASGKMELSFPEQVLYGKAGIHLESEEPNVSTPASEITLNTSFAYDTIAENITLSNTSMQGLFRNKGTFSINLLKEWTPCVNREFKLYPFPYARICFDHVPLEIFNRKRKQNELSLTISSEGGKDSRLDFSGTLFTPYHKIKNTGFMAKLICNENTIRLKDLSVTSAPEKKDFALTANGLYHRKDNSLRLDAKFALNHPEQLLGATNKPDPLKGVFSLRGNYDPETGKTLLNANAETGNCFLAVTADGHFFENSIQANHLDVILSSGKKRLMTFTAGGSWPYSESGIHAEIKDVCAETFSLFPSPALKVLNIKELQFSAKMELEREGTFSTDIRLNSLRTGCAPEKICASLTGNGFTEDSQIQLEELQFKASADDLPLADMTASGVLNPEFSVILSSKLLDIAAIQRFVAAYLAKQEKQKAFKQPKLPDQPMAESVKKVPLRGTVDLDLSGLTYTGELIGSCNGRITDDGRFLSTEKLLLFVNGSKMEFSGKIEKIAPYSFQSELLVRDFDIKPVFAALHRRDEGRILFFDMRGHGSVENFQKKTNAVSKLKAEKIKIYPESMETFYLTRMLTAPINYFIPISQIPFVREKIMSNKKMDKLRNFTDDFSKGKIPLAIEKLEADFSFSPKLLTVEKATLKRVGPVDMTMNKSTLELPDGKTAINAVLHYKDTNIPINTQGTLMKPVWNMKSKFGSFFDNETDNFFELINNAIKKISRENNKE